MSDAQASSRGLPELELKCSNLSECEHEVFGTRLTSRQWNDVIWKPDVMIESLHQQLTCHLGDHQVSVLRVNDRRVS